MVTILQVDRTPHGGYYSFTLCGVGLRQPKSGVSWCTPVLVATLSMKYVLVFGWKQSAELQVITFNSGEFVPYGILEKSAYLQTCPGGRRGDRNSWIVVLFRVANLLNCRLDTRQQHQHRTTSLMCVHAESDAGQCVGKMWCPMAWQFFDKNILMLCVLWFLCANLIPVVFLWGSCVMWFCVLMSNTDLLRHKFPIGEISFEHSCTRSWITLPGSTHSSAWLKAFDKHYR